MPTVRGSMPGVLKPGAIMAKANAKAPVGQGGRFAALKSKLAGRSGKTRTGKSRKVNNPGALAAYIGRKKYGKKRFQSMAAHGRGGSRTVNV